MSPATSSDQISDHQLALTYRQTAEALGVCERTVWKLVREGRLRAIHLGRAVRIPKAELDRFLAHASGA